MTLRSPFFLLLTLGLSACSPNLFSGGGKDEEVLSRRSYTRGSPQCSGLNLNGETLSPQQLKGLVSCLNGKGQLQPIEDLIQATTPEQLQVLTQALNRTLLKDPGLLAQIHKTWEHMRDTGLLSEGLELASPLLLDTQALRGIAEILNEVYAEHSDLVQDLAKELGNLPPDAMARALGLILKLEPLLRDLDLDLASAQAYLNTQAHAPLVRPLLTMIAEGILFDFIDAMLGRDPKTLPFQASLWGGFVAEMTHPNEGYLEALVELFVSFDQSVGCIRGTQAIHNGVFFSLGEVARSSNPREWLLHFNPLLLSGLNGICSVPARAHRASLALFDLDRVRVHPTREATLMGLVSQFVHAISLTQTGRVVIYEILTEPNTVLAKPFLHTLLGNPKLLLAVQSLTPQDQEMLQDLTQVFLKGDRPERLIKLLTTAPLLRLKEQIRELSVSPRALTWAWQVSNLNELSPFMRLMQLILASPAQAFDELETWIQLSKSPILWKALAHLHHLNQQGHLVPLMEDLFALFEPHRRKAGPVEEVARILNPPQPVPLAHAKLSSIWFESVDTPYEACSLLNSKRTIHSWTQEDLERLGDCLQLVSSQAHLGDLPGILAKPTPHGLSTWKMILGAFDFFLTAMDEAQLTVIGNGFLGAVRNGKMQILFEGLASFFPRGESPLAPYLQALSPTLTFRTQTQDVLEAIGRVLAWPKLPQLMNVEDPPPHRPEHPSRKRQMGLVVRDYVTIMGLPRLHDSQILKMIADYDEAVTSWEPGPRREWEADELLEKTQPLVQALGDPNRSHQGHLVEGLVRFLHRNADQLVPWLEARRDDYQVIQYWYPGEAQPRLRLVNSLDRLELVLINADFRFPSFWKNYGLQFLGQIALANGDEPGGQGQTLEEVYFELLDFCKKIRSVSAVLPRHVEARIHNIQQVIGVFRDNLPTAKHPHAGGMSLIRDLFYEFYITTPPHLRNGNAGMGNNLKLVGEMARLGALRQAGLALRKPAFPLGLIPALAKSPYLTPHLMEALVRRNDLTQTFLTKMLSQPAPEEGDLLPILNKLRAVDPNLVAEVLNLVLQSPTLVGSILTLAAEVELPEESPLQTIWSPQTGRASEVLWELTKPLFFDSSDQTQRLRTRIAQWITNQEGHGFGGWWTWALQNPQDLSDLFDHLARSTDNGGVGNLLETFERALREAN